MQLTQVQIVRPRVTRAGFPATVAVMLLVSLTGLRGQSSLSPSAAPLSAVHPTDKQWPSPLRGINAKAYIWSVANPKGFLSDASFRRFASWNVNVVHLEISVDFGSIWYLNSAQMQDSTIDYPPIPANDSLAPYRKNLQGLDTALTLAGKYDIQVIPFLTVAVGRKKWPLFDTTTERSIHTTIGHVWEEVVRKHGNDPHLIAYNLYDEPFFDKGSDKWPEMVQWLSPRIRANDTATYLLVTSTGSDPFENLSDSKLAFVFNYFSPVCYTHQGFLGQYCQLGQVTYPNTVTWEEDPPGSGNYKQITWTASVIRQQLVSIREFQNLYNIPVFCGGITVIRQAAPSESQWITDVLDGFEEYGWSWSYHSYGGWHGWNITVADNQVVPTSDPYIEYGGDTTNDRFKTVSAYWLRNALPAVPALLSPPDKTADIVTNPSLTWDNALGAMSYHVQVSTDSTFATTVFDQGNITATSQTVTGLSNGTLYFWRVSATNAAGAGPWSAIWSFTTSALSASKTVCSFGAVRVDSSKVDSVTISNICTMMLNVSSAAADHPDYTVTPSSATIPAGDSSKFYVTFRPSTEGNKSGHANFVHNAPGSPFTVTLTGSGALPSFSYEVSAAWNIVSVPLAQADPHKTALFPTAITPAYEYAPGTGYVERDSLRTGIGYWMKFSTDQSVTIAGLPLATETVDVKTEWNLIGSISKPITTSSITSEPPGIVTSSFFAYTNSYVISDTIFPGKGYWVKVNKDGQLQLSSTTQLLSHTRIKIVHTSEMPPSPPWESIGRIEFPKEYNLGQNYPNPFNPSTTISYELPTQSHVTLKVFDVLGREVATLVNTNEPAGYKSVTWDAANVPSGIYFFHLQAGTFIETKKLLLLR